jgi:enoyl-CoA hydratase/carnithine racemase
MLQIYNGLTRLLKEAAGDDRVVITALTGVGDFYSSGNDLTEVLETFLIADVVQTIKQGCNRVRYES